MMQNRPAQFNRLILNCAQRVLGILQAGANKHRIPSNHGADSKCNDVFHKHFLVCIESYKFGDRATYRLLALAVQ